MDIHLITWQQTIPLRHQVLWPNKPCEYCHIDGDSNASHFGAFIDGELVSVASIYIDSNRARLRKFATDIRFQNQGIGTQMLTVIIDQMKADKIDYFWCDARESALGFYQRFGMQVSGERFYKGDVAYYKMGVAL